MTENLKSIAYSLSIVSLLTGIFEFFNLNSTMKKYVKYIISLVVILVLFSDLLIFSENCSFDFNSVFPQISQEKTENDMKKSVEYGLKGIISNKFGIPEDAYILTSEYSEKNNEIILEKVTLFITNKTYNGQAEKIELYLTGTLGIKVEVKQSE